jgi:hypothetical protein
VLDWLNRNAPAVQALASIASVLLAVALVWITGRYVRLTRDVAKAAQEQLRYQKQSGESDVARLLTMVKIFRVAVREFPDQQQDAERIRDVPLWKHGEVSTLASLAPTVLGRDAHVHHTVQALNWLRDKADEVQQTKRDEGYQWNAFPWTEWTNHVQQARTGLEDLRKAIEATHTDD